MHTCAATHTDVIYARVRAADRESVDPTTKFSRTLDFAVDRQVQVTRVLRHSQ